MKPAVVVWQNSGYRVVVTSSDSVYCETVFRDAMGSDAWKPVAEDRAGTVLCMMARDKAQALRGFQAAAQDTERKPDG